MINFKLDRDNFGQLVFIDAESKRFAGVDVLRAFPLTEPTKSISIVDNEGREILFIVSLHDVLQPERRLLEE